MCVRCPKGSVKSNKIGSEKRAVSAQRKFCVGAIFFIFGGGQKKSAKRDCYLQKRSAIMESNG